MPRRKLEWFAQNEQSPLVVQVGKPLYTSIKGRWRELLFMNNNPIVLELGCGKGEYTTGLAQRNPSVNYVGVDIKGDRLARGVSKAVTLGLSNVAFLRADIRFLSEFFDADELAELWLTFPDPHAGSREAIHRLTHPAYLSVYHQLLVNRGLVHVKTDNEEFFAYTLSTIATLSDQWAFIDSTNDLYSSSLNERQCALTTTYEKLFFSKGFSIKYAIFSKKI
jgi:tRNA (guanine-N7-)-methyltransferase